MGPRDPDAYASLIGENFYGGEEIKFYKEKINGSTRKYLGNIPYPVYGYIDPIDIKSYNDLSPKLYIDPSNGKLYNLDKTLRK